MYSQCTYLCGYHLTFRTSYRTSSDRHTYARADNAGRCVRRTVRTCSARAGVDHSIDRMLQRVWGWRCGLLQVLLVTWAASVSGKKLFLYLIFLVCYQHVCLCMCTTFVYILYGVCVCFSVSVSLFFLSCCVSCISGLYYCVPNSLPVVFTHLGKYARE